MKSKCQTLSLQDINLYARLLITTHLDPPKGRKTKKKDHTKIEVSHELKKNLEWLIFCTIQGVWSSSLFRASFSPSKKDHLP